MPRTILLLLGSYIILAPVKSQDLEAMIRGLRTPDEVHRMWEKIGLDDQTHRGLGTIDSIDNRNFKLMLLLIKHHGYPVGSITPNVIFTHQRSVYVREHYFPILHKAYVDGKADTFWFMHNVRGIHRGRSGFDLLQPSDSTYGQVLDRMAPYLPDHITFDLAPFDSLYNTFMKDVVRITSSPAVHRWVNAQEDRLSIHQVSKKLYLFKLWGDGSYGLPQRIQRDPNSNKYTFWDPANKTYLIIDTAGNLTVKGGQGRPQRYSIDGSH